MRLLEYNFRRWTEKCDTRRSGKIRRYPRGLHPRGNLLLLLSLGYHPDLGGVRARACQPKVRTPGGSRKHQNTQEQDSYKPEDVSGIMKERPVATNPMHSQNLHDQAANPSGRFRSTDHKYLHAVSRRRATTRAGERTWWSEQTAPRRSLRAGYFDATEIHLDARTPERKPEGFPVS